jgi:nucleoside-triphosphatase
MTKIPRILLTGPPQCGKTTVVQRVVARFHGRASGFYTQEVRQAGRRLGFEIVTLEGRRAWLSHMDFGGPHRVGKYGVNLDNLHQVALPALEWFPGVELIVVDEIGKMECLSSLFVASLERVWAAPVALLLTVAQKGGGYIQKIKEKPDKILIRVNEANRDQLPEELVNLLGVAAGS